MSDLKLYMVLIGCTPKGRLTEQHDIFFGIGRSLKELVPEMQVFWPEAEGRIHVDGWREVTYVDGHRVSVTMRAQGRIHSVDYHSMLFFLNLGGYRPGEFEEYHYKMIVAAASKAEAIAQGKKTAFFKHNSFKGARAHIDDKYGVDVDDIHFICDILPAATKARYSLKVSPAAEDTRVEDELHVGYFNIKDL